MGLLQKTINLSTKQKISFSQFTKKHNVSLCAVLTKSEQEFLITASKGFDCISIVSSVSSADFWEGTIKEKNKWYSFTNNAQMLPFYQFFSFDQKDKINSIHIYFTNENKILLICDNNANSLIENQDFISDFNLIDFNIKEQINFDQFEKSKNEIANKYCIDFSKSIESIIKNNLRKTEYADILKNTIYNQFDSCLKQLFNQPNYVCNKNNGIFNILYITQNEIPINLLRAHLVNSFKSFLQDEADKIIIEEMGKAASFKELIDFLQAE